MKAWPALWLAILTAAPAVAAQQQMPLNIGIDQRLNEQLPLDTAFRNEAGAVVKLGDVLGGRPAVLVLAYFECPMLCSLVLQATAAAMKGVSFDAGDHYQMVTVSFNPKETPAQAAAAKKTFLELYGRPGGEKGVHFLTGDEAEIRRLTQAAGFRYAWDTATNQYAHGSGIMILTDEGRLARYFYGIEYAPRDLRLALVEASKRRIGTPVDAVLLLCYHYDPVTGKYGLLINRILQAAGILTAGVLGLFILLMIRLERRAKNEAAEANGAK